MFLSRITAVFISVSSLGLLTFLFLFLKFNAPGLTAFGLITAIAVIYGLIYTIASVRLVTRLWAKRSDPESRRVKPFFYSLSFLATAALLVIVFLDSTVFDYYQPVSIFDEVIAALGVAWGFLAIAMLFSALPRHRNDQAILKNTATVGLIAILGWPLMGSLNWVNNPQYNDKLSDVQDLFVGGVDGYAIYRIPGLLVVPAGSQLGNGEQLKSDLLIGVAEARRDAALDTGVIDLVTKVSKDGGKSWSQLNVVCTYEDNNKRGKCGNPTPAFDQETGIIHLAHNISNEARQHWPVMITSRDGGLTWSDREVLPFKDLIFGPGHGIQKQQNPAKGRLIIPGYLNQKVEGRANQAVVLFSDDHGNTWQTSEPLNTGDETAIAELADGRIYMNTRQHAALGRAPAPNGRWVSTSSDGGMNWLEAEKDLSLLTPVCQASVEGYGEKGLLFANPANTRARVNMTVRYSEDQGNSWKNSVTVYPGAAGYSDLGTLSNGDVAVLFENGVMSYSEKITIAMVPESLITPQ